MTISGQPQRDPERQGSLPRRARMFVECVRYIADDPIAAHVGRPIGDGFGLEGLVDKLRPLFSSEQSLIRWVALRGALTFLYVHTVDPESRSVPFSPVVEKAMGAGFGLREDDQQLSVASEWGAHMTPEQREAAMGVACAVGTRAVDYPRIESMSIHEVLTDEASKRVNAAIGLDIIAWSAVALLRAGIAESLMQAAPQPDALSRPGWFIDPLWAKAERYWDGTDWTGRCRVSDGYRFTESSAPIS